jgi:hypothetical protein
MKGGSNADIQTNQEETTECKRLHKEPIYMPNFTFYFIASAVSRLSLEVSIDETNRD